MSLDETSTRTIAELTERVLSTRPLLDVLPDVVRIRAVGEVGDRRRLSSLLRQVADMAGARSLVLSDDHPPDDHQLDIFEEILSRRLELDGRLRAVLSAPEEARERVIGPLVEEADRRRRPILLAGRDGIALRTFHAGDPGRDAVVIVSACGMPAMLCEGWMRRLAEEHFVLTWETRAMFRDDRVEGRFSHQLSSQVEDLFAVMERFGVGSAHLMGLCGGAVIALAAAAAESDRVSSVSVWHGDFDLGPGFPQTEHQRNLKALLAMAAESLSGAEDVRSIFCESVKVAEMPADLAHLIVYPYANDELFFRYAKLNGAIMEFNVQPVLGDIRQPVLVVTSRDDRTAHPAGSFAIAERLAEATLEVTSSGDHIEVFRAHRHHASLLSRFLSRSCHT